MKLVSWRVYIDLRLVTNIGFIVELSPNSQSGKPKDRNERGETALHICAKKGDFEGAKKMLEQGISPNVSDFAGEFENLSF